MSVCVCWRARVCEHVHVVSAHILFRGTLRLCRGLVVSSREYLLVNSNKKIARAGTSRTQHIMLTVFLVT